MRTTAEIDEFWTIAIHADGVTASHFVGVDAIGRARGDTFNNFAFVRLIGENFQRVTR